jgi:hypothetical protein
MMIIVTLSFIPLRKNQGKILIGVVAGFGMAMVLFSFEWLNVALIVN